MVGGGNMNKISKSIKKFRAKKGLSQNELADILFVSRQTVSSWENGRTQPDIEALEKLSNALSVSVEELIYGEQPKLIDDGKNEKSTKTMITLFAVFASLFVFVGCVLVFVTYWSDFPISLKTTFSVLPLLVGQGVAIYTFIKKYNKPAWREGAAILWTAGVMSTVALLDGVLNLATDFRACALIDLLLILPIMYVLDAVSPLIVYYGLSITFYIASASELFPYYFGEVAENQITYLILYSVLLVVLIMLGAGYVFLHRKESEDSRHNYAVWISVIASIVAAFIISFDFSDNITDMFNNTIPIIWLMGLYALKNKWNLHSPVSKLVPLVLGITSVYTIVDLSPPIYTRYSGYWIDDLSELKYKIVLIVMFTIFTTITALVTAFLIKLNIKDKARLAYIASLVGLSLISIFGMLGSTKGISVINTIYIIEMLVVIMQGVTLSVIGAKEFDFYKVNVGLLLVIAMIMVMVFWLGAETLLSGIILICLGVCLFAINFKLSKSNSKKVEEIEHE